jgi:hypothetical protein
VPLRATPSSQNTRQAGCKFIAYSERVNRFRFLLLLISAHSFLLADDPKPETIAAFDHYVKLTEDGFAKNRGFENFLWVDHHPNEKSMVWLQQSIVRPNPTLDQGKEIEVPGGEIQHWIGVVFVERADTDVEHLRGLLLNFGGYKDFFKEQIIDSKLNKHEGDNFDFLLRFYKKQFSTVVLNVDESGKYTLIDPLKWSVACHSTHIGEAEHPKDKKKLDEERPPEAAAGYLWRLNFYWRVEQADNGCYVELEVITLARQEAGRLHPSHYLTGFQDFPRELTQYLIDSVDGIFVRHR